MITLYVSVAVLIMIVTAALAPVEAQQIDLGADLDNVFWLTSITVPKFYPTTLYGYYDSTNGWSWNLKQFSTSYVVEDLPAWVNSVSELYFVVCVTTTDFPSGNAYITLKLVVKGTVTYVYVTESVSIANPEKCFTSTKVTSDTNAMKILSEGVVTIYLEGPTPKYPPDAVSVKISKVGIAPPEDALNNSVSELSAEELAYISADTQGMLLLGLGAIMIAILAFVVGSRYR